MNSAYIGKLMELAEKDSRVTHILADSGTGYDEMFRRYFPDQMLNFGIAEEQMVSAAAGMAMVGKIPFVFTAGAFLAYRAMEFIRDDICFQNLNVKLVGMGSGLSWSSLGPTHHTTEDVSVLRALPNLTILAPATPNQVRACVQYAYEHTGPVYIKTEMNHEKEYYPEECRVSQTVMDAVRDGRDVLVFVTGSILEEAMNCAQMLDGDGISVKVINVTTLKPFSESAAIREMEPFARVFTVEEHNIHGGLGSILAETIAYNGIARRIIPLGLEDRFAEGYGTHPIVRMRNKLSGEQLYESIKEFL